MERVKRNFLACLVAACGLARAFAEPPPHLSLGDLQRLRWPDVVLESAAPVTPDPQKFPHTPPYAKVDGVIGGNIRFELLLPESWNGRFCMGGGGGFVGTVQNEASDCIEAGYATVGTDTGHEWQPGYSAGWAYTNLEAQVNFPFLDDFFSRGTALSLPK